MGDRDIGPDRTSAKNATVTNSTLWLSRSLSLYQMRILVFLEANKGPDRERTPPRAPPHADEESGAVEPLSRVSDRSRSPQRKGSQVI